MVGRIGQALGLRMVRSGTTSKQHQSTNENGGDTRRHLVWHTLPKIVITQHQSINHRRHPRRTTSLKLFPIRHPHGSSEVEVKSLALKALDPFRVLLRCHPFSWNWCLRVGSEARTPSAGHQTPPARYHSEGLLPPCHGALQGLGGSLIHYGLLFFENTTIFSVRVHWLVH